MIVKKKINKNESLIYLKKVNKFLVVGNENLKLIEAYSNKSITDFNEWNPICSWKTLSYWLNFKIFNKLGASIINTPAVLIIFLTPEKIVFGSFTWARTFLAKTKSNSPYFFIILLDFFLLK